MGGVQILSDSGALRFVERFAGHLYEPCFVLAGPYSMDIPFMLAAATLPFFFIGRLYIVYSITIVIFRELDIVNARV